MAANQQKMGPTGTAAGASHRLVSVPLIPHREHQRRRLLEEAADSPLLSSSSPVAVPNATWLFSPLERIESAASRPRRYPRRRRLSTLPNHPTIHGSNSLPHPNHPFRHLLDHHQQQQQTRQQQQQQVVSLYQGLGTHYADVWVGTPPQRQTLIVDTGSATTAFACSACSPKRCGRLDRYHTDPLFREGKSSSFAKIQCADCFLGGCHEALNECQLHVAYQEGSNWSAFEAEDRCYVGGLHTQAMKPLLLSVPKRNSTRSLATEPQTTTTIPPAVVATPSDGLDPYAAATDFSFQLRFGCQTQMTGPFRTQLADGIMGMDIGPTAIWNQMYLQNIIAARAFSLCFSRQANARRSGTQAGALTLGGTDVRLHAPGQAMVYSATNMDGAGFFSVKLHHVYLRLEDEEPTDASVSGSVVSALAPNSSAKLVALDVDEKKMNHGEIIIDSGTTDTYFVHQYVTTRILFD